MASPRWPVDPTVAALEPELPAVPGLAHRATGPGDRARRWGTRHQAAGSAGRSLQLDPVLDSGVLEFSNFWSCKNSGP